MLATSQPLLGPPRECEPKQQRQKDKHTWITHEEVQEDLLPSLSATADLSIAQKLSASTNRSGSCHNFQVEEHHIAIKSGGVLLVSTMTPRTSQASSSASSSPLSGPPELMLAPIRSLAVDDRGIATIARPPDSLSLPPVNQPQPSGKEQQARFRPPPRTQYYDPARFRPTTPPRATAREDASRDALLRFPATSPSGPVTPSATHRQQGVFVMPAPVMPSSQTTRHTLPQSFDFRSQETPRTLPVGRGELRHPPHARRRSSSLPAS
ncbi:hypothetical protein MRB53_036970 [Persea americana]|nr:hypothetical protein MRB53_036970 [Persea americana]